MNQKTIRDENDYGLGQEDNINHNESKMPLVSAGMHLYFDKDVPIKQVLSFLNQKTEKVCEYSNQIEITYHEIKDIPSWDIEEVLTMLFKQCSLREIQETLNKFNGTASIDVWFYHYETYPALIFSGKNMEIIHALKAEISIDPY